MLPNLHSERRTSRFRSFASGERPVDVRFHELLRSTPRKLFPRVLPQLADLLRHLHSRLRAFLRSEVLPPRCLPPTLVLKTGSEGIGVRSSNCPCSSLPESVHVPRCSLLPSVLRLLDDS